MPINGKRLKKFIRKAKPKVKKAWKEAKPKIKKFKKRARVISSNIDYYFAETQKQARSMVPRNQDIRF